MNNIYKFLSSNSLINKLITKTKSFFSSLQVILLKINPAKILPKRKNLFVKQKKYYSHRFNLSSNDIDTGFTKGKVSVVLPVYNCEKYLAESIKSVLSQTYVDIELIIVDDGSTDKSSKIADSFLTDPRVSVIHQKNLKLPAALNNGFAVATGEFLTWTSADNIMMPNCIETLTTELIRDKSCDMVYANMYLIDKDNTPLKGYGWYEFPPMSGNVILPDRTDNLNDVANNTIGAAFMYRSGIAKALWGYCDKMFMLEDYDYFMRLNSFFSIKHTLSQKPIYKYRIHTDSLTANDTQLGITAKRPSLMEFDKIRRHFYTMPLYFYINGYDTELENALKKIGFVFKNPNSVFKILNTGNNKKQNTYHTKNKSKISNRNIHKLDLNKFDIYNPLNRFVYINIDNFKKSDFIDKLSEDFDFIKIMICRNLITPTDDYHKVIYKPSATVSKKQFSKNSLCIKNTEAIASFIAITSKDYAANNL